LYPSAVEVVESVTLELTVKSPDDPDVDETSESRDPFASVSTLAVTPIPALLIAVASVESVLLEEPIVTVCAVPDPTWMLIVPVKVSDAFVMLSRYPEEVAASEFTTIVCVPATAEELAAVKAITFGSELDPCLPESTPEKSVKPVTSLDNVDKSVPKLEIAVSCASEALNSVFQGLSTFCRFATIWLTVELTSNPVPAVGEPKLKPTAPIPSLHLNHRSPRANNRPQSSENTHGQPAICNANPKMNQKMGKA
jgi:hypothetical protein